MKSIFAILAMMIGIACYAEVFDNVKANELYTTWMTTRKAADKAAWEKYYFETEFNKEASDAVNSMKLRRVVANKYKGAVTKDAVYAAMDKEYKLTDEAARFDAYVYIIRTLKAYDLVIEAIPAMDTRNRNASASFVANNFLSKGKYDEAIKYASMVNPIDANAVFTLQRAYGAKGDVENAFKIGERFFLETYITNPAVAMRVMTSMMNQVPASYDDAKLADLLAKIGKKYPAPGADFEAWKGFMGFVGYRYKALTGKDLFANSNK